MPENILFNAEEHMEKTIEALGRDLSKIRTGRANPRVFDSVLVEYYGAPTPLAQMAQISVPEPRMMVIKPYDRSVIGEVEKAINLANLGFNPSSDGEIIRIVVPQLTEETRKDLAKKVHKLGEETKVAIRNVRRHANDDLKKLHKDNVITEDEQHSYQDDVQKLTDQFIVKIDEIIQNKENDVLSI